MNKLPRLPFLLFYPAFQLIKRDELNVNCESEVYDAVLAWVKYEERNRRPKLEQLLAGVRCVFLTPNFLRKQIQQCEILKSNQGCRDYLSRIFKVGGSRIYKEGGPYFLLRL